METTIAVPKIAEHHAFHAKWETLQKSLGTVLETAHSPVGWVAGGGTQYDKAINKAIQRLDDLKSDNIDYSAS